MHTYRQAYIHTDIHTHSHAHIHTCMHSFTHPYTHTTIRRYRQNTNIKPAIHTHTYIQKTHILRMCIYNNIHTNKHTCRDTGRHTYIHAGIHTDIQKCKHP